MTTCGRRLGGRNAVPRVVHEPASARSSATATRRPSSTRPTAPLRSRRRPASIQCHVRRPAVRLRHARGARRSAARPGDRQPRGADLPDRGLRLRGHRARSEPLRAAAVRQHLLAHHEPDRRRVRGANRRARERHRSGGNRFRAGGAAPDAVHVDGGRGRVRLVTEPLRRELPAVRRELPEDRHQRTLRRRSATSTSGRPR